MQLSISTRHGHLSESTQEKIKAKADKLVHFYERLSSIELTVDLSDQQLPKVDVKVSADHKHDFVSHSQCEKLFGAVEDALHKIEQQLRKYKKRVQQRHRNHDLRHQDVASTGPQEVTGSQEPTKGSGGS
ncbi:MAG: ribosome-associated translation inhibitor RaiA [Pirellulales bacterium]